MEEQFDDCQDIVVHREGDFALAQYTSNGILASGPGVWLGGKAFVDWGGSDVAYAERMYNRLTCGE
jgi:hypothetical protein